MPSLLMQLLVMMPPVAVTPVVEIPVAANPVAVTPVVEIPVAVEKRNPL
jgi:hypothetical protein